jgi:DNA-damage-inducible protein J
MDAVIETHVSSELKLRAEAIYSAAGVSLDEVVLRLLQRSVDDGSVPYGLFGPNAETREAMQELKDGKGKSFSSVAELMADLNADD